MWNVTQTGTVYYMRESNPKNGAFDINREDVKNLGILITTTGVAVLVNADDTLHACQTLAAARPHDYGSSGPVDVVQMLPESEGLPFLPVEVHEALCEAEGQDYDPDENYRVGVDMWLDDEGRILDKHLNPFASIMVGQDIYGDVVLFGCRQGETICLPYEAYEKLHTSEWMPGGTDKPFIRDHPTRGFWTVAEARTIVDSLDSMGRETLVNDIENGLPDDSEATEAIVERFREQGRRNSAALMFATVGFEAEDYNKLMKEAEAL